MVTYLGFFLGLGLVVVVFIVVRAVATTLEGK